MFTFGKGRSEGNKGMKSLVSNIANLKVFASDVIGEGFCKSNYTRSSIHVNLSRPREVYKVGKLSELLCSDLRRRRERGRIRFSIVTELDQNV